MGTVVLASGHMKPGVHGKHAVRLVLPVELEWVPGGQADGDGEPAGQ